VEVLASYLHRIYGKRIMLITSGESSDHQAGRFTLWVSSANVVECWLHDYQVIREAS
jgi:hypothetical protein